MSDKDLVFRGEVLARKCKYYVYDETGCCCEEFAVPVEDINRISAAPHEMLAEEFVRARDRMCAVMAACADCPYKIYCIGARVDAKEEVAIVEKWAREHPERSEE